MFFPDRTLKGKKIKERVNLRISLAVEDYGSNKIIFDKYFWY